MSPILYSEVNIFCILICLLLLHQIRRGADQRWDQRLFVWVLLLNILLFLSDWAWIMVDGAFIPINVPVNFCLNALYFIITGFNGYCWFIYSETLQNSPVLRNKTSRFLCLLPALLLVALAVASYWTGWLFTVDSQNIYHRGPLYFLHLLIVYGYMVSTAIKARILSTRKENFLNRVRYRTLASFVILPFLFGTLQVFYLGIPLICVGISLSLINVYFSLQDDLISIDPLTQLNNRSQLFRFLHGRMARGDTTGDLHVIILDVDYFKSINDKYGHIEGDAALIRVAEALKNVCANRSYFAARYGGDEFVLVGALADEAEMQSLKAEVAREAASICERDHLPYALTLSIGCAKYSPSFATVQDFIQAADAELYEAKRQRR